MAANFTWRSRGFAAAFCAAAAVALAVCPALGDGPNLSPLMKQHEALSEEVNKVLGQGATSANGSVAGEHPLAPILRYALEAHGKLCQRVHDYQCQLVKRERINGTLQAHQVIDMKLRQQGVTPEGIAVPFAVYMKFQSPEYLEGREVLYVAGQNQGNLVATKGGRGTLKNFTLDLATNSRRAMEGTHYPVTEIGMLNLTTRLIEDGLRHVQHDKLRECRVTDLEGAKINGRECRYIQVVFPHPREGILFNVAQIFIDKQLELPVRYASYSWPKTAGGQPEMIEEFTYVDVRLNVGLTDADFERKNPNYRFFISDAR